MSEFFLTILFVIFASTYLWVRAVMRLAARRPLVPAEPWREVPWGLFDICFAILLQFIVQLAAHEWFCRHYGLTGKFEVHKLGIELSADYVAATACASLIALLLTVGWLVARYRPSLSELAVKIPSIGQDLVLGFRAFVMLAPVVYGIQALLAYFIVESEHPLLELLKKNPSSRFFVMSGFAAVIAAPLAEEFFFRMLLQGWFERLATGHDTLQRIVLGGRSSELAENMPSTQDSETATALNNGHLRTHQRRFRWTIIASALLFAIAHAPHGPDPVPLFVLALGLGYLYQTTGRIIPSIVVHMLLNGATLAMMWLVLRQES